MSIFTLMLLAAFSSPLMADSINPARTTTPLINIFSPKNKEISSTTMEVMVSTSNKSGDIKKDAQKIQMEKVHYLLARKQSLAVFQMVPKTVDSDYSYKGTAFHVGGNLVLTNHHVLSPDRSNKSDCGQFRLLGNQKGEVYACKKVHHCEPKLDVCLIEMESFKKCLNFTCSKNQLISLRDGPALKLKEFPAQTTENVLTAIGNTMGLGIHYSQGKGFAFQGEMIFFYAPLRSGNSGGPLLGQDGLVWGVVKAESQVKYGDEAYNAAALMTKVISVMRDNVKDKMVLSSFEQAISQ